jgi:TPR repeat protein
MVGLGREIDYDMARQLFVQASSMGHVQSHTYLGMLLLGDASTHPEAVRLFEFAANNGDALAKTNLVECYVNNMCPWVSWAKAVEWHELCVGNVDARLMAKFSLALKRNAAESDRTKAIDICTKAAEKNMGLLTSTLWTTPEASAEAVKTLEDLSVLGDLVAEYQLAIFFHYGCDGLAADETNAKLRLSRFERGEYHPLEMIKVARAMILGKIKHPVSAGQEVMIRDGARWLGELAINYNVAEALAELKLHVDKQDVARACCTECGQTMGKLKRCVGCKVACFCSDACQKSAWKIHKKHCRVWAPVVV